MARTTIRTEDITASEVTTAKMAVDPTNASNLSSGSVPLAQLGNVDTTGLEDDIAILGFKVASNGSLAKYNLVDQTVDDFQSEAGIDTSTSTSEKYDSSGKFYVANSTAASYVAKGGGAGGNRTDTASLQDGYDGGNGGGGGVTANGDGHTTTGGTSNKNTYSGWISYGYDGGTGQHVSGSHEGAGGGAGPGTASTSGTGGNSSGGTGGAGGNGYETGISGTGTYYAQGGAGGGNSGGSAAPNGGAGNGSDGAANTGRGGGGDGDGGSGVAYIQYTPSGGSQTTDAFTASGTWTVPASTTQADVFLVGGGGAGGWGSSGGPTAGGGGGGAILRNTTFSVTAGDAWTVTIGTGGTSGANSETASTNGGDTSLALNTYDPTMSLVSNSTTAEAVPTKGDMVLTYTNEAGTATINTDIKGYVSRDNGSNWTQGTFVSQGTTGGHTILSFHDLDVSSQPSGTSMRYKVETLNQAVGKQTRIYAVSLGWS